jgi:hypothetical protein
MSNQTQYTLLKDPEAECAISACVDKIKATIATEVCQCDMRALVLLGGYGKGEGGVHKVAGKYRPHNNFDLLLVTREISKRKRESIHRRLAAKLEALSEAFMAGIDLSIMNQWQLELMPTRVLWYDMREGHKTLLGDRHFIPSINHERNKIPAWDVRNLMVNRGSLLLINLLCMQQNERSEQLDKLVVKHTMKAIIGYGDALLFCLGDYHWSYQEKQKRLLNHAEIDLKFKKLYEQAMSFRRTPTYNYYLANDLSDWHAEVMQQLEKVHLRCESLRLGLPDLNWDGYLNKALFASLFERGFTLKAIARKILNAFSVKHGHLPASVPTLNKISYWLSDKESLLPLVFPYIAFNPKMHADQEQLTEFLASHFGTKPTASIGEVIRAYLKTWAYTFDRNLDSVLLKNNIAL